MRFEFLDVTTVLRLTLVPTVVAVPFLLDDPLHHEQRALPVSLHRTLMTRLWIATGLVMTSWLAQLAVSPRLIDSGQPFAWQGMLIEPFPFVLLGFAAGLSGLRSGNAGVRGVVACAGAWIVCWFLPEGLTLFLNPVEEGYAATRWRWAVLSVMCLIGLVLALRRWAGSRRSLS
ncbi:hypothetical protein ACMYYO_10940 [Dermacoccaceae bacterium W4C1]